MTTTVKVLSVAPHWAWAIIHGPKRIENRSWRVNYRGPIWIHASKSTRHFGDEGDRLPMLPPYAELIRGAIIGVVDVVDCRPLCDTPAGPFTRGPYCWILQRPRAIAKPLPLTGRVSLFPLTVEPAMLALIG